MCVQLGFQLQCAVPIQYSVMRLNCTEPSPMQYPTEMHFSSCHPIQSNTTQTRREAYGERGQATGRRLNTALCPCTPRRGALNFASLHCGCGIAEYLRQYFAGGVLPIDQLWTSDTGEGGEKRFQPFFSQNASSATQSTAFADFVALSVLSDCNTGLLCTRRLISGLACPQCFKGVAQPLLLPDGVISTQLRFTIFYSSPPLSLKLQNHLVFAYIR